MIRPIRLSSTLGFALVLLLLLTSAACGQKSPDASTDPRAAETASSFIDAIAAKDFERAQELATAGLMGPPGEFIGPEGYDVERSGPVTWGGDSFVATVEGTYTPEGEHPQPVTIDVKVAVSREGEEWVVTSFQWGR